MSYYIGHTPTNNDESISGIFNLRDQAYYEGTNSWPNNQSDPHFNKTTLILRANSAGGSHNNSFIAQNFISTQSPGHYSVYFNGNNYLSIPDNSALQFSTADFTLEYWFCALRTGVDQSIVAKIQGAFPTGYNFGSGITSANKVNFGFISSGSTFHAITSASSILPNTWYHVAVSRTGTTINLFLNGILEATSTVPAAMQSTTAPITIGYDLETSANRYFLGYISNVRLIKGVSLYSAGFTSPSAPLQSTANTSLLICQSGTLVDNSSNKFNIEPVNSPVISSKNNSGIVVTRNGNTTQGAFSPYGDYWSNYFDGNGDYLTVPDSGVYATGTNNFTLECWIYPTQNSAATARIISQQGSGGYWALRQETNTIAYFYLNASTSAAIALNSGAVITPNLWYHLAVVRNGNTFTLYVNGVSTATGTSSGAIPDIARVVAIGAYFETTASEFFTGNISNLRLVTGDSAALYTANFTPPTAPLTAITGTVLLTCQSNRFRDASANNFAITRNGDVSVQKFSPFNPTTAYDPAVLGASAYFDGTGDYLTIVPGTDFTFGTGDITVECWAYIFNANSTALYFIDARNSGQTANWALYRTASNHIGWFNGTTEFLTATNTLLATGGWQHIAYTRAGTTTRLFLNGNIVATGTDSTNYTIQPTVAYIAARHTVVEFLNGYMSGLRVIKGTALYTANFTPPTTPLTAITNTSLLLNFTNAGIIDNSALNNLETVGNAQISAAQSRFGGASLAFDGTGDWLVSPDSTNYNLGSGDFTIEFWIRFNSLSGNIGVLGKRASEANYAPFLFEVIVSGLRLYMSTSGSSWAVDGITTSTLSTNTWYHIAATRSGSTVYLFLNGTSVGTTGTLTGAVMTNISPLYIGANSGAPTVAAALNGYIDDLRITKGTARYVANFTPPTRSLPIK